MKRVITVFLTLFITECLLFHSMNLLAQEKADTSSQTETRLALNYLCTSDDSVTLTAALGTRKNNEPYSLKNAEVEFGSTLGKIYKILGKAKTNQYGAAALVISVNNLPSDKEGMINYSAKFEGVGRFLPSEATFSAKPGKINLSFGIQDSLRHLNVTATQIDIKGNVIPLPKEIVVVYVPRLFSLLKIGEVSLEEDGTGTMEFPTDIVGDTLGNLSLVAKIEENDRFGNLQGQGKINWGVHKQYYNAEVPSRELWTPIAPLWMIITLIIMLAGVWAHYFYAIYELIMIKRSSKKVNP